MVIEGNEDSFLPCKTFGDDLGLGLVYDMPDSMRSISNKELDLWGVTFYEALEAARENLLELNPMIIRPKEGEGLYVFATNDGYDATRLILLDVIRQFQVQGDYIAMAPSREMPIVGGSEDGPGLTAMIALAMKTIEQPRSVSGMALRLAGDEWVPWMPDVSHRLYEAFRLIRMRAQGRDYAEQKELLDALHQKIGKDVFVASASIIESRETGQSMSYCVWPKGATSLLPCTERIVFGGEDQTLILAPWEKVFEVVGDLMTPLDTYPERYQVEEFPTAEQLAAIGNELKEP